MFKFLKDKLNKAVSLFSKNVEEDGDIKKEEILVDELLDKVADEPGQAKEQSQSLTITVDELLNETNEEEREIIENSESMRMVEESARLEKEKEITLNQAAEEKAKLAKEEQIRNIEEKRILEEKEALARKNEDEQERQREEKRIAEEERTLQERKKKELEDKKVLQERLEQEKQAREAKLKKIADEEKKLQEIASVEVEKKEPEKKGFLSKIFSKKKDETKIKIKEESKSQIILDKESFDTKKEDFAVDAEIESTEKKGIFGKIKETLTTVKLSDEKFNELFWELEVTMLENNVAVEVIEKIKEDLRQELTTGKVQRRSIEQIVQDSLKQSIIDLFSEVQSFDLIEKIKSKNEKPFVISFIGVNGSGKTTSMAKVANLLKKKGLSVVFAASDTFRAAAIQQLQEHADKLEIKMIKHDYESDPAAVAFDAIKHAKAKGIDVVLIDTAGRLHTNDNLMNELKKLIRVNQPDLKIFLGEAITGNDCVEQAKLFNDAVGIDAIILAKADVDEKGGAAISVSYITKKPIIYLGIGQTYDDLIPFNKELILKNIGL